MDILSTGEKIRRTRVYKGLTLKEICMDDISVSKLSCIENDKVKADKEILKLIAKRLDLDLKYLLVDSKEQLYHNLEKIQKKDINDSDYEDKVLENLNNSEQNGFIHIALEFNHLLFEYALLKNKNEKVIKYISKSYNLYKNYSDEETTLIYYKDFAKYLLINGEYNEAITYYQNIIETMLSKTDDKTDEFYKIKYYLSYCLYKTDKVESAYAMMLDVINNEEKIIKLLPLFEVYNTYSVLCILNKIDETDEIIKKTKKLNSSNKEATAKLMLEYSIAYFNIKQNEQAISQIKEGIKNYPKEDIEGYINYLKLCIETLYQNEEYPEAFELTDEALNYSIENDDMKIVEKIYCYKGSCLQKMGNYRQAEIYLNLSLDSLFKCGTIKDRYKRYMNLGDLYYNLNETKEAIKYFSLANAMYKKR